jgi:hypothetical protein
MKGNILSGLFLILMTIMIILIVSGLIWVFTEIYGVEARLGLVNPRQVTLRVFFEPLEDDSALLSFLECQYDSGSTKITMKKLLTAVAIQGNTTVWLDGNLINVSSEAKKLLDEVYPDRGYILKISNPEIIIATSCAPVQKDLQVVKTKLFLLDGNSVDLELYVNSASGGGACAPIRTCSDGTNYGQCSSTKPQYCDNGNLINACGLPYNCRCPNPLTDTCNADGTCTPPCHCSDGTDCGQCSTTGFGQWCDVAGTLVPNQCGPSYHNCLCTGGVGSCQTSVGCCLTHTPFTFSFSTSPTYIATTYGTPVWQLVTATVTDLDTSVPPQPVLVWVGWPGQLDVQFNVPGWCFHSGLQFPCCTPSAPTYKCNMIFNVTSFPTSNIGPQVTSFTGFSDCAVGGGTGTFTLDIKPP